MRIWRKQEDGTLVDAAIEPKDLVFLFGANEPLPIGCPLRDTMPPANADYAMLDASGWHFVQDRGFSKPFNITDLMKYGR